MTTTDHEAETRLHETNAELLAALKGTLDLIEHIRPHCDHHGEVIAARAAIAKAEGGAR